MAKCHVCRDRDAELLTVWQRTRYWLFVRINSLFFTQDYADMQSEKFTQGFGDGYIRGTEDHKAVVDKMAKIYGI